MKFKIASLFSGCGGLDLGFSGGFSFYDKNFERLDTEVVFANDFDKDAATCYNSNPLLTEHGSKCRLVDIRNIDASEIPDFDILLAGFPCQPFQMLAIGKAYTMIMDVELSLKSVSVLSVQKSKRGYILLLSFLKMLEALCQVKCLMVQQYLKK